MPLGLRTSAGTAFIIEFSTSGWYGEDVCEALTSLVESIVEMFSIFESRRGHADDMVFPTCSDAGRHVHRDVTGRSCERSCTKI